jgi:putative pyruvate formate lyase activating enzyme
LNKFGKKIEPSYIKLLKNGQFTERIAKAEEMLTNCVCCPRKCQTDRTLKKNGFCKSGCLPVVSSYTKHMGEEPVISGVNGAGNVFFGNCNLRCVFCQNHEISQNWNEENKNEVSVEKLASIMLELQSLGCHNIGLVSPTHFSAPILKAIFTAAGGGLKIPIVYNSNGYDSVEMLKLFEGIIDIYLPDFKWGDNLSGSEYSKANNYFDSAKKAVKEMFRQTGSDFILEDGILKRGMIVRHLVMPNELAETENVFRFISEELSADLYVSVMSQYYPVNKAMDYPLISRKISLREYEKAVELLEKYGLKNGFIQELESYENYRPDFSGGRENPFNN